jgi:chloride channel protein, CIC family
VGVAKRLSYGTIYHTKLLRRGTDRTAPPGQPLPDPHRAIQHATIPHCGHPPAAPSTSERDGAEAPENEATVDPDRLGTVVDVRTPQTLLTDETLDQALRQLVLYGPEGLPVVSPDQRQLVGWITNHDVIQILTDQLAAYPRDASQAHTAAEWATTDPRTPPSPLPGHEVVELAIGATGAGRTIDQLDWPPGVTPLAIIRRQRTIIARPDLKLDSGDHLIALATNPFPDPTPNAPEGPRKHTAFQSGNHGGKPAHRPTSVPRDRSGNCR